MLSRKIATGVAGHSFSVYLLGGELFAMSKELAHSFILSDSGFRGVLHRLSVQSSPNKPLRKTLGLKGKVQFLEEEQIEAVLRDRIKDAESVTGILSELRAFQNGEAPTLNLAEESASDLFSPISSVDSLIDSPPTSSPPPPIHSPTASSPLSVEAPEPLAPPPQPTVVVAQAEPQIDATAPQQLELPIGDAWLRDESVILGKRYALKDYDKGEQLLEDVRKYRMFWELEHVPGRDDAKCSGVTLDKRVERIFLFCGFLYNVLRLKIDPKMLTLSVCINIQAIQLYLEWQLHVRKSQEGGLVDVLTTMVSVAKFIYRNTSAAVANGYQGCEVIQRMRSIRNGLQTKQRLLGQKTIRDLEDDGKWLSWASFHDAISHLQQEFDDYLMVEDKPSVEAARLLHDLLILQLYSQSPSRSGEISALQHFVWDDLTAIRGKLSVGQYCGRHRINVIAFRENGPLTMWIGESKAFKHHGVDETVFQEAICPDFIESFRLYVDQYRPLLLPRKKIDRHPYLFMNQHGEQFPNGSLFGSYLGDLLERLTGHRATSNVLRSSFVSNLMESSPSEGLKDSAASLLRHGRIMQASVYDRRHPTAKKMEASLFAGSAKRTRSDLDLDAPATRSPPKFARDDLVVVPYLDKESRQPSFWFAKVQSCSAVEVTLMQLVSCDDQDERIYKADLRSVWTEPISCVYHADAINGPAMGRYTLLSTCEDILALLQ